MEKLYANQFVYVTPSKTRLGSSSSYSLRIDPVWQIVGGTSADSVRPIKKHYANYSLFLNLIPLA